MHVEMSFKLLGFYPGQLLNIQSNVYTVFTRLNVTASISYLSVKNQCSNYSNVTAIRYLKIIFAPLNLKFIVTLGAAFSKVNMVSENLNCLFITCYVFVL